MKKIGKFLAEALFPSSFTCDICGVETFGSNICPDCIKAVTFNNESVCPVCGRKNIIPEICKECKVKPPVFKKAVSPLVYDGKAIILIAKFKNGSAYLKDYFASLIAEKLAKLPKPDCIVYVPMTKKAVFKREYNQSELLAKSLSEIVGVPVVKNAVLKIKETPEQKLLSRKERENNLKGCFKVEKINEIKGKKVLLIDDVLTTGATADAVGKKLLDAGAECTYLATVAAVEYKEKKKDKK